MNYDEKQIWLKSLKVGDEVCVSDRYGEQIETILKITPTGIIKTKSGDFKNGTQRNDAWRYLQIEPATAEVKARIRLSNLRYKVSKMIIDNKGLDRVTDEKDMLTIIAIIKKYEVSK